MVLPSSGWHLAVTVVVLIATICLGVIQVRGIRRIAASAETRARYRAISIAHEGEHLVLHLPQQQGIQLLAMSATDFFVRKPDLVVPFDTDLTGRVAALTVGQGETKQRFIRKN